MRFIAFVAATTLASLATVPAAATEYLAAGTKLVIKDSSASKKLVYLSKDPSVGVPTSGGADDPSAVGATFTINSNNINGMEIAQFTLPASGWTVQPSSQGMQFRFVNPEAPAGSSPVRSALIRAGLVKLKAQDSGITLDENGQIGIGVRLDAGTSRWCSGFGTNIVKNQPGLFKAKAQDSPPAVCTLETTTTTSTTLPHVCGNGIIEGPEQCDGDDFCTSTCALDVSGCCQYGALPDFCAVEVGPLVTDSAIYFNCVSLGGTFMLGSRPAGTLGCPEAPTVLTSGPCEAATPVSPTTLCCQQTVTPGCFDSAVSDTAGVSSFYRICGYTEVQFPVPVVVGTCGPGGVCVPAH